MAILSATVRKFAHHVEVRGHERIIPLFVESKRRAGETGDKNYGRSLGVTSSLCPDLSAVLRGNVDRKGGSGEGERGKK